MCIEFQPLNKFTIKNKYPLPIIDDLSDQLHGAKSFSTTDLRYCYHQVRFKEKDIPKTTFRSRYKQLEFLVMSFRLIYAPTIFMDLMNVVFHPFPDVFMIIFIDDILVYSHLEAEHSDHLWRLLRTHQDCKLYTKLSKCEF